MFEEKQGGQCHWSAVSKGEGAETLEGIGQLGQVGPCKSCQSLSSSSEGDESHWRVKSRGMHSWT